MTAFVAHKTIRTTVKETHSYSIILNFISKYIISDVKPTDVDTSDTLDFFLKMHNVNFYQALKRPVVCAFLVIKVSYAII